MTYIFKKENLSYFSSDNAFIKKIDKFHLENKIINNKNYNFYLNNFDNSNKVHLKYYEANKNCLINLLKFYVDENKNEKEKNNKKKDKYLERNKHIRNMENELIKLFENLNINDNNDEKKYIMKNRKKLNRNNNNLEEYKSYDLKDFNSYTNDNLDITMETKLENNLINFYKSRLINKKNNIKKFIRIINDKYNEDINIIRKNKYINENNINDDNIKNKTINQKYIDILGYEIINDIISNLKTNFDSNYMNNNNLSHNKDNKKNISVINNLHTSNTFHNQIPFFNFFNLVTDNYVKDKIQNKKSLFFINKHKYGTTKKCNFISNYKIIKCPNKKESEDYCINHNQFIAVADGVGSWIYQGINPKLYPQQFLQLLEKRVDEKSKTDDINIKDILSYAYEHTNVTGSATFCVILFNKNDTISTAVIGDSQFIIIRNNQILYKSKIQQYEFNFPYQLGTNSLNKPDDADFVNINIQQNDIIIAGTDGLWDNLYDHQILNIVNEHDHNNFYYLSEKLANEAYNYSKKKKMAITIY